MPPFQANYAVYSSGFHVVNARLNITEGKADYAATLSAGTQGFLRKLAPWDGIFRTKGWIIKGALQPETHETVTTWRGEAETKTATYQKDGTFAGLKVIEQGRDRTPKDFDPAIAADTTDLLSVTLAMMRQAGAGQGCNYKATVFDGKRSFDMAFRQTGTEKLAATKYNSYTGDTLKCEVEITPKKGKWHEKPRGWLSIQEQGRKKGSLPVVWLGKVEGQTSLMPVKLKVTSDYGTLFMHMITPTSASTSAKAAPALPASGKSAKQ